MQEAYELCQARVREADRDRFLATLFAPERQRGALFALYAFDAEIAEVRDRITSPLPGEVRLQWWRDVLTGTEPGDAAANPIAAGLLEAQHRFLLPVSALLELIDAHTFDLYDEPMATLAQFEGYAVATSGAIIRLAAYILSDGQDPGLDVPSRHAAIACTVTGVLRRLGQHAARGQRYLPDEVLIRHGAVGADLLAGRVTGALRGAAAEMRQVARRQLESLRADDNGVPYHVLPAFLPVSLVPSALARMERQSADLLRPPVVPQWRRQWIMWRAARNPERFIRLRTGDPAGTGGRQ